jgi:hypothetical protein
MPVMMMEAVLAVAVSPDGRRIVSGSGDTVCGPGIWKPVSG